MLINGDIAVDDRGTVAFVNDFDFKNVKRFYVVSNYSKGFVRAWHGHKKEGKYVLVVSGAALVATVDMEDDSKVSHHTLSAIKPQILFIPPGNYNGYRTLTDDTKVMFFSTLTMEEAKGDDYREDVYMWKELLEVEER